jgi:hypothetical protein
MPQIFLSYRRSDSEYIAPMLSEKLQQHFGEDSVFFDVDTIPLGVDFREYIGNKRKFQIKPTPRQKYSKKFERVLMDSPTNLCLSERFHRKSLITQSRHMQPKSHRKMSSYSLTIQFSEERKTGFF